jgi:TIGR03009 family protein
MRSFLFALIGVVVLNTDLFAQQAVQSPTNPPLDPRNNRLDALLLQWEAKMKMVDTLSAEVTRVKEDRVFKSTDTYQGRAKYKKPNLASLELHRTDKPEIFEKYISTGNFLYEFSPSNKEVRVHELPRPKPGQVSEDNFLSFLFGMKAEEAKRRYDLKLLPEDKYYYYIEVRPRYPADKADFQLAQLALLQSTFMPAQLTFFEPNGNRVTWSIRSVQQGVTLDRNEFTKPELPRDWKFVTAPRVSQGGSPSGNPGLQPRVVRPKP